MKKIFFLIPVFCLSLLVISASAETQTNSDSSINLEVPIAGEEQVSGIGDYISKVYTFAVGVVGLAAVIMIMIGGYLYMTSHGNATQAEKGKDFITSAVLGLIIVLVSYVILRTINPNLVGNFATDFGSYFGSGGNVNNGSGGSGQTSWQRPIGSLLQERYKDIEKDPLDLDTLDTIYRLYGNLNEEGKTAATQMINDYLKKQRRQYPNPSKDQMKIELYNISDTLIKLNQIPSLKSGVSGGAH